MNLKYIFGSIICTPLLPFMYYQGKKIRSSIPRLPEADGTQGKITSLARSRRAFKLLTIGESTIAGVGVETHEEGFTGTLAQELSKLRGESIDWRVYARSGYTAKMVVEKIIPKIDEVNVDLIVIGLGGNDAFTLNSPSRWKVDINYLIAGLRSKYPHTPITFCNMPPIKDFPAFTPLIKFTIGNLVEILGRELDLTVQKYPKVFYSNSIIKLADWIEKFDRPLQPSDFFSDGVHPSKLTYQTWAREIADMVRDENIISETKETINSQ